MKKVGILGGGQLGRMLLQAAANYPVETSVLENDTHCPAAHLCHHFINGDITSFNDVYQFGKQLDALTIEIENVNIEALKKLEQEGITIVPKPAALKIIKNKILQKRFYKENEIPTSEFVVTEDLADLSTQGHFFPAVHKLAEGGYDGKGVQVMNSIDEISKGFASPAILEKQVKIKKEIALTVAVSSNGEMTTYPPVDMIFDQQLNLLSYQLCPADLAENILQETEHIAVRLVKALKSAGIFAVEFFIDVYDNVFVNETAPRVHNSGHHTIESCYSSQFDMLWRIMLGYPLGNTQNILPAAIVNLVGEKDFFGPACYEGLEEVLRMENAFVHIYGKALTKPGRKMGHVTILSQDRPDLLQKINRITKTLKVISR